MRRAIVLLTIALPVFGFADEVFLKGGGKMTGEVVSEDGQLVVLEVGPGKVTVPAARVLRIERSRSPLGTYRERASRLAADDVQGWLELAFWAQERDLDTQAQEAFERVLRLDPGNASANGALGRVQMDGRWMSPDESYRARGYVSFEGEWMTPAEHEARLRVRAAERQAQAAQREGELRVREAEARAQQAEAEARRAEAEAESSTYGGIPYWWGWGGSVIVPPVRPFPHPILPPRPRPVVTPVPPPSPPTPPPASTGAKGTSRGIPRRSPNGS